MFRKIKDLIAAYKVINKERIEAKNKLKCIENLIKTYKKVHKTCLNLQTNIKFLYKYFPEDQRKDFIQDTLDLLEYGAGVYRTPDNIKHYFYVNTHCGWIKHIENLITDIKYTYSDCYDLYNDGKYKEISTRYDTLLEVINGELFSPKYSYKNIEEEYNKIKK